MSNTNTSTSQPEDQLPFVIESIGKLNRFLQPEKSIRMILFLWSRFSPKCADLINSIPDDCKKFFYYINIDNPGVRESIINSSSVKVTEVPCIIVVYTDGLISTYEGNSSIDIIKSIHSIAQKITQSSQSPQSTAKNPLSTVTPLSQILGTPSDAGKSLEENKENEEYDTDEVDDSPINDNSTSSRHSAVRSKIRRAERPMDDHTRIKQQNPPDVGLSTARNYPTKGMGHGELAHSSLGSDIKTNQKPHQKQKALPIMGGEMLDDDLDEMLDEDVTIDPIIRNIGKSGSTDKKEAMMNVKKAAEEMMRMREQEGE